MEVLYILWLLVLNYFVVDASSRVEREASCPKISDFPGRVKYRRKGTRAVFRCPKNFDLYGKKRANCLDDGTWSDEPPLCIKAGCIPFDPSSVNNLEMDVVNGALVKFSCLQNYILIGETMSYCNGKDWSAPLPRCAAPHELTECDFEQDLCGWTQDDSEEQDWIRQVGPTATGNTGPKFDHTLGDTGSGHYMFFETSSPTMTGHQANLLSPVYTENLSPMCFDFWYHILGPDEAGHVGTLEVYILDQSQFFDDDNIEPVFMKEGNQGDMWHRGEITVDKQVEPYQIAIVARKGLSYISDIAIDDVRLFNCSEQTSSPEPTTTRVQTKTTKPSETTINLTTEVFTITPTGKSTTSSTTLSTVTEANSTFASTSKAAKISSTKSVPSTTSTLKTTKQTISTASSTTTLASGHETSTAINVSSFITSQASNKTSSVQTEQSLRTSSATKDVTPTTTISTSTEETTPVQSSTPGTSKSRTAKTTFKTTPSTTQTTKSTASTKPTEIRPSSKRITDTTATSTTTTTTKATTKTAKPYVSSTTTPAVTTSTEVSRSTTEKTLATKSSTMPSTSLSSTSTSRSTVITTTLPSTRTSLLTVTTSRDTSSVPSTRAAISTTRTKATVSKVTKSTKRTNVITTKRSIASNTTKDNSISVSEGRSQHPEDDTLKPLLIGLCVGIVAGLIIIGVIAYVCVRRRKFYTSRYEDELKPITNSASIQSLNNGHYYQDEEYESES